MPKLSSALPGVGSQACIDLLAAAECPALTQRRARRHERAGASQDPIVWEQAAGANVVDVDGNVFVDLSAGFGAASVGHSHPRVVEAVQAQSAMLMHALGDLHPSGPKIALLSRLVELFADISPRPMRAMLGLSGSDAVEAALKTAVLHTGKPGVVAFEGGYHGLSHGPLALCGYSSGFREPFRAQLNPHVSFAPYPGSAEALSASLAAVSSRLALGDTGAVVVEPILGRGGVVMPPREFLPELAGLCRKHGALFIVDEIMTGFGRTGRMFAIEESEVEPDLVCLGKALGGGLPVSACVGRADVMSAWSSGSSEALHTGTFFGHALGAAAAIATLDVLDEEGLSARAASLGGVLQEQLLGLSGVAAVRGRGLLVGVELSSGEHALRCMRALLERGYITVPASADARVISLTPPLCITSEQLDGFVSALTTCLMVTA